MRNGLAVLTSAQLIFPDHWVSILKTLARDHFDDGVRYNVIALLDEAGHLSSFEIEDLLAREPDPDTGELLYEIFSR